MKASLTSTGSHSIHFASYQRQPGFVIGRAQDGDCVYAIWQAANNVSDSRHQSKCVCAQWRDDKYFPTSISCTPFLSRCALDIYFLQHQHIFSLLYFWISLNNSTHPINFIFWNVNQVHDTTWLNTHPIAYVLPDGRSSSRNDTPVVLLWKLIQETRIAYSPCASYLIREIEKGKWDLFQSSHHIRLRIPPFCCIRIIIWCSRFHTHSSYYYICWK